MRLHRSSALLLGTALVLGAVVTPAGAFADTTGTTTTLTPDQAVSLLTDAQSATAAAGQDGWDEHLTSTDPTGAFTVKEEAQYAVIEGRGYVGISGDLPSMKVIEVNHRGSYVSTSTMTLFMSAQQLRRVLAAIGHPGATWIYQPDKSVDVADPTVGMPSMSPAALLGSILDPSQTTIDTASQAVAADGTTTYDLGVTVADTSASSGSVGSGPSTGTSTATMTLTTDAHGVLTSFGATFTDESDSATFSYGPQHVALPPASEVVTVAQIAKGIPLVTMGHDVATIAATVKRKVAATPHRAGATVRMIRRHAWAVVGRHDRADHERVFSTRVIDRGVRVRAINPFLHTRVVWSVKALGKRVVIHRL